MLEEVGAPYETRVLGYGPEMKAPAYLALNPMGKVPCIVHDGQVVTEAAAICAYLAFAFPEAGLAPEPQERADFFRWMFFAAGPGEAAITNAAFGFELPDTDEARGRAGYGSLTLVVDALAALLADGRAACLRGKVHRRRCLCRRADPVRAAVRHPARASRLCRLRPPAGQPPAQQRAHQIDDALLAAAG